MVNKENNWQFFLLKGKLSFNNINYDTPFEFINAVDEYFANRNAHLKHESGKESIGIDYAAIHLPTAIALTQLWGLRYADQQDCFAMGDAFNFAKLNHAQRLTVCKQLFIMLQEGIKRIIPHESIYSGSTACIALVADDNIYLGNLGDSVAYLCQFDQAGRLQNMTQLNPYLHQAANENERRRIEQYMKAHGAGLSTINEIKAGMNHPFDPRLKGLQLTASLGDCSYDSYGLLHAPENIAVLPLTFKEQIKNYIVLATDGLTERLNLERIKSIMAAKALLTAKDITFELAESAFASGSTDNITVLAKAIPPASPPFYFAVFDGHGGNKVSRLAAAIFNVCLQKSIEYVKVQRKK